MSAKSAIQDGKCRGVYAISVFTHPPEGHAARMACRTAPRNRARNSSLTRRGAELTNQITVSGIAFRHCLANPGVQPARGLMALAELKALLITLTLSTLKPFILLLCDQPTIGYLDVVALIAQL